MAALLDGLTWQGHASFRLQDGVTIYFDPWELKGEQPQADLILVTHPHYDHLSVPDIKKLVKKDTVVIGPKEVVDKLAAEGVEAASQVVSPGGSLEVKGVAIQTPAAYNPAKKFHPKENGWVGYRIQVGERSIYHTGDTDETPEARAVRTDVLLIPIGGTYTMTAEEGARLADVIKPQVAVPMHWGKIVGSIEDAHLFKSRTSVPVTILEVER